MIKVKVLEVNRYFYTLEDENKNRYKLHIEFYDVKINAGDYLILSNKILEEKNLFAFGPLMSDENLTKDDIIKVIKPNEEVFLQRYYG